MKSAILTRSGFEIREVPAPEYGADEVLVEMRGCGVCGGDIGPFKHRADGEERTMGHESGGVVSAVGEGVSDFSVGDPVAVMGGEFAEYSVQTPAALVRLADTVDPACSLGEPVACCVHAMGRNRMDGGERVAVVGCGFMGLVCLQLVKAHGAGEITAIDPIEERRAMARKFGAADAFAPDGPEVGELKKKHGDMHGEYDIVVEAAGIQPALDLAGHLVKQHGLINLVGHHYSDGGMRSVYMNQWNVKAIDVVNGHVRRDDEKMDAMRRGMDLVARGELQLEPLVTCYPLSRIQDAFEDIVNRKKDLIKAVIMPDWKLYNE